MCVLYNYCGNLNINNIYVIFKWVLFDYLPFFKKRLLTFRGEGRENERKRNITVWEIHWLADSCTPPSWDPACNPGMWPDWELDWRPFHLQAGTQPTEPHQPGLITYLLIDIVHYMEIKLETPNYTVGSNTWGINYMYSFWEKIFQEFGIVQTCFGQILCFWSL